MTIRLTLAVGLGFASVLSVVKILSQINLIWFLIPLYAAALLMMKFSSKMFVGLAFDSGGVTAGGLTSAFLTPFAFGIALAVRETVIAAGGTPQSILLNGFGILSFMSVTPLIAVQTLGLIYESRSRALQKLTAEREHDHEALEKTAFLTIITERKTKDAVLMMLLESDVHIINTVYGKGTADASFLKNTFGLVQDITKVVIICVTAEANAAAVMDLLADRFEFNKPNKGIAFTMPVDNASY
jgi:hypothetical protein